MKYDIKVIRDTELYVKASGRLDTMTAVTYGNTVYEQLDDVGGITKLILDFAEIEYVSSMGLRIILDLQKRMKTQGEMVLMNVNEEVKKVFEMTGFSNILTIL